MPTYVALMNWTGQGIRTANKIVQRRDQANALAQKHGASRFTGQSVLTTSWPS